MSKMKNCYHHTIIENAVIRDGRFILRCEKCGEETEAPRVPEPPIQVYVDPAFGPDKTAYFPLPEPDGSETL